MKTGGPAFPRVTISVGATDQRFTEGMSLRDYFAAQALPAVIREIMLTGKDEVALAAYKYADAMLAERDKQDGR